MLSTNKLILLLGARQTGKTTITKTIQKQVEGNGKKTRYLNCDLDEERRIIDTDSITVLKRELSGIEAIFIDEAQRLKNAGLTLKIIHDYFPRLKVLATGSSAFELKNKVSDAMTGRYFDYLLYPFSLGEVIQKTSEADYWLTDFLRFGGYPEVCQEKNPSEKIVLLGKIIESYLFKDIFTFQKVRNSDTIKNLTRALAYQLGSEVNENELSSRLKINRKTVVSYIDILEQAFVIIRLRPFSKNPRREIGRHSKIYFLDPGVRNALIGDFNELDIRNDTGALWENFLLLERLKKLSFEEKTADHFFWRTYNGAEVDLIEQPKDSPQMKAYEFKWKEGNLSRGAGSFKNMYKVPVNLINRKNYYDFIITPKTSLA